MDVWLVQPPIGGNREDVAPPLGLLALAATLAPDGHRPHVVDLNLLWKTDRIDRTKHVATQLANELPKSSKKIGAIGITTWSYNFDVTMELVLALRSRHPKVPIVLGGPHVTFVAEETLGAFPQVDLVVRDEGDRTFPRVLRALESGAPESELALIPGLSWRKGDQIVRNPSGPVVEDLDGLPFPRFDLVDVREYVDCSPVIPIEAGRGCPYNCNFCSTTNMFQRKYRVKSPKRLVDELVWFQEKFGHSRVELLHDNLVASRAHVKELCQEIRGRNLDLSWSCTSRTDNMTEELIEAMFLAGCVSVFYGIESMDERRQHWTGKKLKPPLVEQAIATTAKWHVKPSLGIIVGFPDETDGELDATVGGAARWTADPSIGAYVSTAALRFYPGADLFGNASRLHHDRVAEADNAAVPGLRLRDEWRTLPRLFPLNMIHTGPEETARTILHRNFTRVLLKLCPVTFRFAIEGLGLAPHELFRRLRSGRAFEHLERPSRELVSNEVVRAFGAVLEATGSLVALELLTCEVPFWRTTPVVPALQSLEHVVHPKRFEQQALLAYARRQRTEPPPEVAGEFLVSIRGGTECLVLFTKDPAGAVKAFERSFAEDPRATLEYVSGLRRGLA